MYVLMENDFPVAVYSDSHRAELEKEKWHKPQAGKFWNVYKCEVDRPGDHPEGVRQEEHLLGQYGREVYDLIELGATRIDAQDIVRKRHEKMHQELRAGRKV